LLLQAGVPVAAVSARPGHANAAVTLWGSTAMQRRTPRRLRRSRPELFSQTC
jgi:hypothetical protein